MVEMFVVNQKCIFIPFESVLLDRQDKKKSRENVTLTLIKWYGGYETCYLHLRLRERETIDAVAVVQLLDKFLPRYTSNPQFESNRSIISVNIYSNICYIIQQLHNKCGQIGHIFKGLCDNYSSKSSSNIWQL